MLSGGVQDLCTSIKYQQALSANILLQLIGTRAPSGPVADLSFPP
jgi:hypothetical protein